MAARQDELRRLMKESKGKTQMAEKAKTKSASAGKAGGSSADTSAAAAAKAPQTNGSATASKQAAIPAGFFDDSLADAKARNVDIKQLAETQLEQDWEQFQDFVAEVEQQDVKDGELQQQETKEKEAMEQLENMQYVDRYRIALERAARLVATGTKTNKRAAVEGDNDSEPVAAVQGEADAAGNDDGEELSVASAVQRLMKKRKTAKKAKKQKASSEADDDDDDEAFDPCNWRSKAL